MNNQNHKQLPPPNPVTYGLHRRQVWWQILLPVIVGGLLVIAVAVLAAMGTNPQVAHWGNISAIMLIAPLLMLLLITLVFFAAANVGLIRVLQVLPRYSHLVKLTLDHYASLIQDWANRTTKPVIGVRSSWAGVRTILGRRTP